MGENQWREVWLRGVHEVKLTDLQVENMRHALGLNRARQPYRNYYCAPPEDTEACASWDELVSAGYATVMLPDSHLPYRTYRLTDDGRAALLAENTRIVEQ